MLIHQKISCGKLSMKFSSEAGSVFWTKSGTETTSIMPDWCPRPGPGTQKFSSAGPCND